MGSTGFWTLIQNLVNRKTGLAKRVDTIDSKVTALNDKEDRREADAARNRILRFADECRRHEKHSEEFFNQIIDDITYYEEFCEDHHEYKNTKAVESIATIRAAYHKAKQDNDFV